MGNDGGDDRASGAVANNSVEEKTVMTKNAVTAADKSTATAQKTFSADTDEVPISEEGGGVMGDTRVIEEGATVVMETTETDGTTEVEPSPIELGMELMNETLVKLGSVAAIKDKHGDGEVAQAVAELERERVLQRQRQADDARGPSEAKQQLSAAVDEVRADERARVNLVRRNSATVDGETDGDGDANVEASYGLPTAAMFVDGAQQLVKIDRTHAIRWQARTGWPEANGNESALPRRM
ncbi:hypothetical protein PF005_g29439 [Phytophthora fragariae]|uniref:Uncharacterized protein n=3 Tax=Phytophthora fragariae TaxID=53985 RepID=A0A6A3VHR4_9STRA|nr:hypothetical protein PF005_g29439 [Phytophthora fragariae]